MAAKWKGLRKGESGPDSGGVLGCHSWSVDMGGNAWFKGDVLVEGNFYHKSIDSLESELDGLSELVRLMGHELDSQPKFPVGSVILWSGKQIPEGWTKVWGLPFILRKQ